jgi:hypothetical protein
VRRWRNKSVGVSDHVEIMIRRDQTLIPQITKILVCLYHSDLLLVTSPKGAIIDTNGRCNEAMLTRHAEVHYRVSAGI